MILIGPTIRGMAAVKTCQPEGKGLGGVSDLQSHSWGLDVIDPQAFLPAPHSPSAFSFCGLLAWQKPCESLC